MDSDQTIQSLQQQLCTGQILPLMFSWKVDAVLPGPLQATGCLGSLFAVCALDPNAPLFCREEAVKSDWRMLQQRSSSRRTRSNSQTKPPGGAAGQLAAEKPDIQQPSPAAFKPAVALRAHNELRTQHNAPALKWDADMVAGAADRAGRCSYDHQQDNPYGENMFTTAIKDANTAMVEAVKTWYAKAGTYDFDNPGYSSECGMFSQLVWAGTRRLGCAVKVCSRLLGKQDGTVVLCR